MDNRTQPFYLRIKLIIRFWIVLVKALIHPTDKKTGHASNKTVSVNIIIKLKLFK